MIDAIYIDVQGGVMFSSVAIRNYDSNICLSTDLAKRILVEVLNYRRVSEAHLSCDSKTCQKCLEPHLSKVVLSVKNNQPVTFVLPAFPGKSPNPAKVIGPLPDMAEQQALEFLQQLCERIKLYYAPGARIILASDGRVFSDVIGIYDENVTAYQKEILRMIQSLDLQFISTFNLEEMYGGLSFDQMRSQLMQQYGEPLSVLSESVRRGKSIEASVDDIEANRLYMGITRFLFEDALVPGQVRSRTSIQKEARLRAYEVIQRSKAWSELIEREFPYAVRLSIHPQSCGSKKIGIRLIEPDNWQTPWHGVAVQVDGHYILMKRAHAEALGASLVMRFGRASHYVLKNSDVLKRKAGVKNEY